ncbi:hypothetical protein SLEP1_g23656 [Rubroshorea leprosula]|uniref:Uncharacterized protein n=1 Tax=Rubroshorea leprosula TaxID=152421 RepID=A0AAV5JJA9_9ROSI|nr:hypothetical protein SLEP1_g23656 [Rubroshorea leprosula]
MMRENTCTEEKAMDLLNQLEFILESDPLIDEVGFIHPSQFVTLSEEVDGSYTLSEHGNSNHEMFDVNALEQKNTKFWNRDHKLGISTQVLLPLFGAAKDSFGAAIRQYKTFTSLSGKPEGQDISCCSSPCVSLESEVMKHSRSLLLLSCDFGTAWNSRFSSVNILLISVLLTLFVPLK